MPQNQYLPIANSPTANAVTPAQWAAMSAFLQGGFSSGEVYSNYFNTFLRQLSVPVSAIAQFMADNQTQDVLDDGSVANFEAKFKAALLSAVEGEGVAFCIDGGSTDALTATPSPALAAYKAGQAIAVFKNPNVGTNTTATPTINLNGLGAVTIVKGSGVPLYAGDLPQGGLFMAVFDGTYFRHIGITLSTTDLRVQAGQAVAFVASGTNAYTGALVPGPTVLSPRMEVLGFFGTANTSAAAPTLLLNGIGNPLPIVKQGGGTPLAGDVAGILPLVLNSAGTAWFINGMVASDILALIAANAPQIVTGTPTLFVRADGSDTNNGSANTAAAAFATLAAAIAYAAQRFALGGKTLQIVLGIPGTYAAPVMIPAVVGAISISTATNAPSNYILQGGATAGYNGMINVLAGANVSFSGVTFYNTATNVHNLFAATGGIVSVSGCTFTTNQSSFSAFAMYSQQGGNIQLLNATGITMSAAGVLGTDGGYISMPTGATITLNGTYTYTDATAHCSGGQMELYGTWGGATPNATRYKIDSNGAIKTNGQGPNYIPGSSAGTVTTNPYS